MTRPAPSTSASSAALSRVDRFGPLALIVLLHVGFFYALGNGLLRKVPRSPAVPREVLASFITPEPASEPPKPQPAAPKTVPVVKKAVAPAKPAPLVNTAPSPNAISAPASPPSPPAQAAPVAPSAPSAPSAPTAPAQPRTITSGVEYIQAPDPKYPAAARRMGEEGKAILRVLVNEKGRAERIDIQKSSGSPRLDDAAKQAAQHALFKPYMEDGKALAVFAIVPITFQLD